MTNPLYPLLSLLILGLLVVTQPGCLVVAAAAGTGATVAYVRGDLETTLDADPGQIADATESAFKDLGLYVTTKEVSGIRSTVVGRSPSNVKMTVVARSQTATLSRVSIRAGTFGDGAMQTRVLDSICQHLNQKPQDLVKVE
jgi:hypothetical protein